MLLGQIIFTITVALELTLKVSGQLINLVGSKVMQDGGTEILFFNCSTTIHPISKYAEFLVNNYSAASSIYHTKSGECEFNTEETRCKNWCKCFSDGRSFAWTFPIAMRKTLYACHIFINSYNTPEMAHIYYDGKRFETNIDVKLLERKTASTTSRTPGIEKEQTIHNTVLYALLVTILVVIFVIVFVIVAYMYNVAKGKNPTEKSFVGCLHESNRNVNEGKDNLELESCLDRRQFERSDTGFTTDEDEMNNYKPDLQSLSEGEVVSEDVNCSICKMRTSTNLCIDCGEYLCELCKQAHLAFRISKDHEIVNPISVLEGIELLFTCNVHGKSQLDHVCLTHNVMICQECMKQHHRKCRKEPVAVVSEDYTSNISNYSENLCEILGWLLKKQDYLQTNLQKIKEDVMLIETELSDKLGEQLKEMQANLVHECLGKLEETSQRITALEKHRLMLTFTEKIAKRFSYAYMLQTKAACDKIKKETFENKAAFFRSRILLTEDNDGKRKIKVVCKSEPIKLTDASLQSPVSHNNIKYKKEIAMNSNISTFEILKDGSVFESFAI